MDIFAPIIGLHSQDITVLALLAEFGGYGENYTEDLLRMEA